MGFSVDSVKLRRESACPKIMNPTTVVRRANSQRVTTCTLTERRTRAASSAENMTMAFGVIAKTPLRNAALSAGPCFSVTIR